MFPLLTGLFPFRRGARSRPAYAIALPDTASATPDTAIALPDTASATPDTAIALPDTAIAIALCHCRLAEASGSG
ncbi:MAG: hypothetical protein JNN26_15335 [Candidatus Obscuribacter sp.]|nr:hypothetical protein [Candidatus Obscuribacter sp.]